MLIKESIRAMWNRSPTLFLTAISALTVGSLGFLIQPSHAEDFTQRFYLNGGVGATQIEPDSPTNALSISDNQDAGGHIAFGYDFSRMISVEAYIADLGTADVDFLGTSAGTVDYQIYGASLLGYLYNSQSGLVLGDSDASGLFRREGLSLYGRMGVGQMKNDAEGVDYKRDYSTHAAFGVGLEYGFRNGLAMRTELMSLDTDAQYLNVGLLKRFGKVAAPTMETGPVEPKVTTRVKALSESASAVPNVVTALVPPSVYFEFDRSDLNTVHRLELDEFAMAMQNVELNLVVAGHTDWIAGEEYNQGLSVTRAEVVFDYLVSKGIPAERMKTIGYGESRPISSNNTEEGRALNRRTEIHIR